MFWSKCALLVRLSKTSMPEKPARGMPPREQQPPREKKGRHRAQDYVPSANARPNKKEKKNLPLGPGRSARGGKKKIRPNMGLGPLPPLRPSTPRLSYKNQPGEMPGSNNRLRPRPPPVWVRSIFRKSWGGREEIPGFLPVFKQDAETTVKVIQSANSRTPIGKGRSNRSAYFYLSNYLIPPFSRLGKITGPPQAVPNIFAFPESTAPPRKKINFKKFPAGREVCRIGLSQEINLGCARSVSRRPQGAPVGIAFPPPASGDLWRMNGRFPGRSPWRAASRPPIQGKSALNCRIPLKKNSFSVRII